MNIQAWSQLLQFLTDVVTIAGVPVGIGVFLYHKRRERIEREERSFDELDGAYVQFMRLCVDHPELDVFPSPASRSLELTPRQKREEEAILAILISLFERVHLAYEDQSDAFRQRQRDGWVEFMRSYAARENVCRVWNTIGKQFDKGFQNYASTELFGSHRARLT
jgi:hypothetical protein